jgi:hypothetical protein
MAGIVARAADELPIVYQASFEDGKLSDWKMTDGSAWKIVETDRGKTLGLVKQSDYQPKVRSPFNYALVNDVAVTDFTLDVNVKSTTRDYGHRDLCLFFGHQDAEHFYYVHLGKHADPHAHSIFLVNAEPRVSIVKDGDRTKGTPWTDGWHHLRVTRSAGSGETRVYFDDMETPIMRAVDQTFKWGKVGVGSFDDTGLFDDLVVRGHRYEKK